MQPDVHFRPATSADVPILMHFLQLIATFDGHPESFVADAESLAHHMFGPTPRSHAILVMKGDLPIGFATYYFTFSTFLGKPGLWLDDLYILKDERGHGTGTKLLNHLANVAKEAGCARIDWIVNQSNPKELHSTSVSAPRSWTTTGSVDWMKLQWMQCLADEKCRPRFTGAGTVDYGRKLPSL